MDRRLLELLCCPRCHGSLGPELRCLECGAEYAAPDGIPALRLPSDERTERVRRFYSVAPFPGYPPKATLEWLRARAGRNRFARLLDEAGKPLPQKRGAADSVTVPEGASVYVLERRPTLYRVAWGSSEGWLSPGQVRILATP